MAVSFPLFAKALGGVVAVASPIAAGVVYREDIRELLFSKEETTSEQTGKSESLTKFDQGLIDYLEKGGDIQFKVIKGTEGTTDLTESDLVFSEGNLTITAQIKIEVNKESGSDTKGTLTDATEESADSKAKKETLQQLNVKGESSSSDWTWVCEIQFISEDKTTTSIEQTTKDKILKGTSEGLFGVLKSKLGNENQKVSKKKIKQNFIKNCAGARENNENFNMPNNNEIKTQGIEIKFKKEDGKSDLTPSDENQFNKWFPTTSTAT